MQAEFASYDFDAICKEWELAQDDSGLLLTFLGRQYRIDRRSGAVLWESDGTMQEADYNVAMTLYDILTRPRQAASGKMASVGSFSSLHTSTASGSGFFDRTAKRLEYRCTQLASACECLGGVPYGRGDVGYLIPVFRDLHIAVQFYDSDEEFPPQLVFLCDTNILRFMHFETMMFMLSHAAGQLVELSEDM